MQWYYTKGGVQTGPLEESELRSRIANGEVGAGDLIWRDGMANWLPMSQIPELSGLTAAAPATTAAASPYAAGPGAPIPNYLWQSIVVTLLCCWPLGIPAIIFAAKVDGLVSRGDIAGAKEASNKAKMWCTWSFGSGLAVALIYLVLVIIGATAGGMN